MARPTRDAQNEARYWEDLERNFSRVEFDFLKSITHQSSARGKTGRAAVLRMSHSHYSDQNIQADDVPKWMKWQVPEDASRSRSSTPVASDVNSSESPGGLVFEDVDLFKQALEILPRRHDKLAVPQFFDKQLLVLEDLGKDWVEIIGKAFHIPPHVFALHWASPSLYKRGRARVPLGRPAEEHFVLPYSEILPFGIKNIADYLTLDCSSVRFVSADMQQDQEADQGGNQKSDTSNAICEAMVSYWGCSEIEKEWTAILLVDPLPMKNGPERLDIDGIQRADANGEKLDSLPSDLSWKLLGAPPPDPRPALHCPRDESTSWRPEILKASLNDDANSIKWTPMTMGMSGFDLHRSHPAHTSQLLRGVLQRYGSVPHRSVLRPAPFTLSTFDQIVAAPLPRPNFHPVHATKFIRRLVLAKMTLIVDIYLRQSYTLTVKAMQNISKIADFDPQRLSDKPWQDEWRSEFFNRLWELRGNIELLGFDMESTIRLCSDLADETSWPGMKNLDTDVGRDSQYNVFKSPGHIKIRDQDVEDLKEWERLEATRKYAAGFIERTTNSYLQAATAEGAKFANIQARTSKKLTFLATLFVPASLCAAVLALPGYSGAEGATRFWLFWVVSVPIAIGLAFILLFQDIRTHISEHRKNRGKDQPEQASRIPQGRQNEAIRARLSAVARIARMRRINDDERTVMGSVV